MTCCVAMFCTDGVLLASDSLISGSNKMTLPFIKGFEWRGLDILYAGDLAYIQKLQAQPCAGYEEGGVLSWQRLLWDFPPPPNDEAEFLVLDHDWGMHVVDKWGAAVQMREYAVVGSELGWATLGMVEQRERTMSQAKRVVAKALRVVAKLDESVSEPFRFKEVRW